jgi:hypothetical protein
MKITCWYCDTESTFEEKGTHKCPVYNHLTEEEASLAAAIIMALDFCDHVHQYSHCCGMPTNICKAVHLIGELNNYKEPKLRREDDSTDRR